MTIAAASAVPFRARGSGRRRLSQDGVVRAAGFILPALVLYGAFSFIPTVETVRLSFTDSTGLSGTGAFIGLQNYAALSRDAIFWKALRQTLAWLVMHVALAGGLGLGLAVLVARLGVGQRFFRSAFFLPHVVSLAVVGTIWAMIYDPFYGLANGVLRALGLGAFTVSWLGDPQLVLLSVNIASSWQGFGLYMLLFLAGLQNIDRTLYEAAATDGAGAWQQFRHVTLPGLREVSTLVVSLALINGLKGFATVWVMTQGGPFYNSELLTTYIYKLAFQAQEGGRAAALCVVLAAISIAITVAFNRLREKGA